MLKISFVASSLIVLAGIGSPASAQTAPRDVIAAPAAAIEGLAHIDADQRAIAWDGSAWSRITSARLKQRIFDDGDRGLRLDTAHFRTPRMKGQPLALRSSSLSAITASASAWHDIGADKKLTLTLSGSRSRRLSNFTPFPSKKMTAWTRMAELGLQFGNQSTLSLGWFATGADVGGGAG